MGIQSLHGVEFFNIGGSDTQAAAAAAAAAAAFRGFWAVSTNLIEQG